MLKYILLLVMFIFVYEPVGATVYWAAHNGSQSAVCVNIDSVGSATVPGTDPGTYGTISRAAECATVAGDVVWVKNSGTYIGNNHRVKTTNGATITAAGLKSGTSELVRTIITGDINGPRPLIQAQGSWYCTDGLSLTHAAARNYITIKHLKIDGGNIADCPGVIWVVGEHVTVDDIEIFNTDNPAIYSGQNAGGAIVGRNLVIRNSIIHNTGQDGQGGCAYMTGPDSVFEYNECYDGRGTFLQIYHSLWAVDRGIARFNYFHDQKQAFQSGFSDQCSFIAFNGANGLIYDNIIVNNTTSCPVANAASYGILVGFQNTATANIYNNLIINPLGHGVTVNSPAVSVNIQNNTFWNIAGSAIVQTSGPVVTKTYNACIAAQNCATANKLTISALTDCTLSNSVYTQKNSSACINAGLNVGFPYNDTAPDIGPYEKTTFATCSVESGDAGTVRVTFNNTAFPPLQPASGITGVTIRKNGVNNPITGSQRTGTNRLDFTVSPYSGGNTIDISATSTNITDSIGIPLLGNQPYVQTLVNQPCTNNVTGGGGAFVISQAVFRFNGLRGTEAAPVATPYAAAPENTNVYVVPGGSLRLRVGLTCSILDCPPIGFIPRYKLNGGVLSLLTDTFGADKIAFCGTSPDPDIPVSGTSTTQQLSGSGAFAAGALVRTSNAIPTIDMALGGRTEVEYCITLSNMATPNATYDFFLTQQDGTQLVYSVTPRATVIGPQSSLGF